MNIRIVIKGMYFGRNFTLRRFFRQAAFKAFYAGLFASFYLVSNIYMASRVIANKNNSQTRRYIKGRNLARDFIF